MSAPGPPTSSTPRIGERGVAIFQRLADDNDQRLVLGPDRLGKQPDGFAVGERQLGRDRPAAARGGDVGRGEQWAPGDARGAVEDMAGAGDELGQLGAPPARTGAGLSEPAVGLLCERGDIVGARAERPVDRIVEVGLLALVDEQPGGGEHDGHHDGKGEREPPPHRQPSHCSASARRRYPLPRIVSMLCRPNGRSTRSRRARTC